MRCRPPMRPATSAPSPTPPRPRRLRARAAAVGVVYTSAQNAGDLNIVVVGWYPGAGVSVSSVTDSKGNKYILAVGPTASSGNATESIYYAKSIAAATAGANT